MMKSIFIFLFCIFSLAHATTSIPTAKRRLSPAKIWHMKFSPTQLSCPKMEMYLEFSENLINPKVVATTDATFEVTMLEKYLAKINLSDKSKNIYSANFFMISNKIMTEFTSLDGKCSGMAVLEKTRIINANWSFKFYPNFNSNECSYHEITAQNKINTIHFLENDFSGEILSGETDEIKATAKLGNLNINISGIVNFEWGNAKGIFESPNCRGIFEAKLKKIENA